MPEAEVLPESRELIALDKINVVSVFVDGGLDKALAEIEERARSIITDPATKKGREEIRSLAARLASTRTGLYDAATALTEGWRNNTKKVNAERTRMEEKLQALQDEIRKPLTEFENNEKIRVLNHQNALKALKELAVFMTQPTSAEVQTQIDQLPALSNREWEEFATQAAFDLKLTTDSLTDRLARTLKYEADQEELAVLRAKQAAQDQKDRDQAIADKAKADADAKALESECQTHAAVAGAYVAMLEADEKEHINAAISYDVGIESEMKELAFIASCHVSYLESEEREHCLVAKAYDDFLTGVANAAKAERDKIAAEKVAHDAAEKTRQYNLDHRIKIEFEIGNKIAEIILNVIDKPGPMQASKIVSGIITAISEGKIPHVHIQY